MKKVKQCSDLTFMMASITYFLRRQGFKIEINNC